jgi:hypothetical protein
MKCLCRGGRIRPPRRSEGGRIERDNVGTAASAVRRTPRRIGPQFVKTSPAQLLSREQEAVCFSSRAPQSNDLVSQSPPPSQEAVFVRTAAPGCPSSAARLVLNDARVEASENVEERCFSAASANRNLQGFSTGWEGVIDGLQDSNW